MFCSRCGTQIPEGAAFCHKCGTKIVYAAAAQQASIISQEDLELGNDNTLMQEKNTEAPLDSVKMVISIDKVTGKAYSKFTFSVFVDGILVGDLANGQTAVYKISAGQHLIKIGGFFIGIDVPKGDSTIELDFHWGANIKPEIICHQSQWVSRPCEREKVSVGAVLKSINTGVKAGLVCVIIGVIGVGIGYVNIETPHFIGGVSIMAIGAVSIILSSRKMK